MFLLATGTQAQWQVNAADGQTDESSAAMDSKLAEFEQAKCANGGPEKRAFIDFSTQDSAEAAYIEQVSQRFSQTIQTQKLGIEFGAEATRTVRFIFEVNAAGAVNTLTVFAKDEDAGLRDFVTRLVTDSVPFPSFKGAVADCYETVVISAILDF